MLFLRLSSDGPKVFNTLSKTIKKSTFINKFSKFKFMQRTICVRELNLFLFSLSLFREKPLYTEDLDKLGKQN